MGGGACFRCLSVELEIVSIRHVVDYRLTNPLSGPLHRTNNWLGRIEKVRTGALSGRVEN